MSGTGGMRKCKAWFFLPVCLEWVGSVCIHTLNEWKARATRRKSGAKLHVTDVCSQGFRAGEIAMAWGRMEIPPLGLASPEADRP